MKRVVFYILLCVSLLTGSNASAQGPRPDRNDWGSRMRSEKIGFLTAEIGLTPQEAQAFWPIYNKAEEEKGEAIHQMLESYGALQEAVQDGKGDFSKLLETYLKANARQNEIDAGYVKEYKKVLSEEKVARLYLAEEKFRREQINKLNRRGDGFKQPQDEK